MTGEDAKLRSTGAITAVVLAAGYGTRMGELGRDRPKALLPVGQRPVLDHLLDRLAGLDRIGEAVLVTNRRFAEQFRSWRRERALPFPVDILDNGTVRPEERLGAVGDLTLAVESTTLDGPVLVAGTDNVFDFPLDGLVRSFRHRPEADAVLTVVTEDDLQRLRASGVPEVDRVGRVTRFHEKPDDPPGRMLAPPLYLFRPEALRDVRSYLDEGGEPDAPGHYLAWLVERRPVYAWAAQGARYDIGTPERYAEARRRLGGGERP